ncbi:aminotransferase class V-fold PLP-dependent enzyme [Methanoregula sp.]|uniref:aminotransferase class V-fold PLP-dependent enzyme n=1 Tax=Methanoregula sp. TaxID=2052170 RepID=UPI003C70A75C
MDTPVIYLNNAATSWPKPPEVIEAVNESFRQPFNESGRSTSQLPTDYLNTTREAVAGFFRVQDPDHIIFTANATDSLNTLIHGFAMKTPESFHVLMTDLDHNSVIRPLRTLEQAGRCSVSMVPSSGSHINPESMESAIRKDTRLVVMAHGSNVLGSVQDITGIGRYLQERNIFFMVDGAQTAGLVPVDLRTAPVDAFVFTGHKYLFGFPGTGGFFIRDPTRISPSRQGGTGTFSKSPFQPMDLPEKFETGTPNYPGIISLGAGIRYLEKTGAMAIERKMRDLTAVFMNAFADDENIIVYNKNPGLPVISLNIRDLPNEDAGFILREMYGVICRTGLHCAPLIHDRINGGVGSLRLSPSYLNTHEECVTAAEAVRDVADRVHCS